MVIGPERLYGDMGTLAIPVPTRTLTRIKKTSTIISVHAFGGQAETDLISTEVTWPLSPSFWISGILFVRDFS